jgi:5'-nucleotidase
MRILICNDDGIQSPGIRALAEAMCAFGEVVVVAPDRQRSASSHGMSLHDTVWVEKRDFALTGVTQAYAVSGTPVDCVKWAVAELASAAPFDLMVSGINEGVNLATDVLYSGTVAAAGEAALQGIPAIAFSLAGPPYPYQEAAAVAKVIVQSLQGFQWPPDTFLSVNLPASWRDDAAIRVTQLGVRSFQDRFVSVTAEGDRTGYRYEGEELEELDADDTDVATLRRGEISVTPLRYHFTNHQIIDSLKVHLNAQARETKGATKPQGATAAKSGQRMVLGTHVCTRTDDLYQLVDFLNRNLKEKDVIFGMSLDKQRPDKMILTLYQA